VKVKMEMEMEMEMGMGMEMGVDYRSESCVRRCLLFIHPMAFLVAASCPMPLSCWGCGELRSDTGTLCDFAGGGKIVSLSGMGDHRLIDVTIRMSEASYGTSEKMTG